MTWEQDDSGWGRGGDNWRGRGTAGRQPNKYHVSIFGLREVVPGGRIRSPDKEYGNSEAGFWLGVDENGVAKFDVGDGSNYFRWDGTSLTIAGDGSGVTNIDGGNIQTGTITATQIATDTITASEIAAGAIDTDELAANAITAAKIAANTITATEIDGETITASEIEVGTLTMDRLVTGAMSDNLVQDAGFESGDGAVHSFDGSGGTWSVQSSTVRSGSYALKYDPGGQTSGAHAYLNGDPTAAGYLNRHVSALEGREFTVQFYGYRAAGTTGNRVRLRTNWYDANGSLVTTYYNTFDPVDWTDDTWTELTTGKTAPAGVAYVVWEIYVLNDGNAGALYFDDITARARIGAELIEANAITAGKINVTQLDAIAADLGTITAGSIVVTTGSDKLWLNDSDDGALNIGGSTKASAPFSVDAAGNLTATSATISGDITAQSGSIAGTLTIAGSNGKVKGVVSSETQWKLTQYGLGVYVYEDTNPIQFLSPGGVEYGSLIMTTNAANEHGDITLQASPLGGGDSSLKLQTTADEGTDNRSGNFILNTDSGATPEAIISFVSTETNSPAYTHIIHNTRNTPAAGFGVGLRFKAETTTTSSINIAKVIASWTDATHASRSGELAFSVFDSSGDTEVLTLTPSLVAASADLDVTGSLTVGSGSQITLGSGAITQASGTHLTVTAAGSSAAIILAPGNSEAVRLLSDGTVGIGESSPDDQLHVSGHIRSTGLFRSLASFPALWFDQDDGTDGVILTLNGDTLAVWRRGPGFGGQEGAPYKLDIQAPNNSLTVDSSGQVGIGTNSPSSLLTVDGTADLSNLNVVSSASFYVSKFSNSRGDSQGWGIRVEAGDSGTSTPSGRLMGFHALDGTTVGNIAHDSSGGVNYNSASDERLKDVIGDIPADDIITMLKDVHPKRYRGVDAPDTAPVRTGFIAQDLKPHTEGVVFTDGAGLHSMDYSRTTPYLWRICQIQQDRIEALEQEVNQLKNAA